MLLPVIIVLQHEDDYPPRAGRDALFLVKRPARNSCECRSVVLVIFVRLISKPSMANRILRAFGAPAADFFNACPDDYSTHIRPMLVQSRSVVGKHGVVVQRERVGFQYPGSRAFARR